MSVDQERLAEPESRTRIWFRFRLLYLWYKEIEAAYIHVHEVQKSPQIPMDFDCRTKHLVTEDCT